MDLNLLSLGTLQNIKLTDDLTQMTWFLLLLRFDIMHKNKHTQDTHGPMN